jgi:hypothetical protein
LMKRLLPRGLYASLIRKRTRRMRGFAGAPQA